MSNLTFYGTGDILRFGDSCSSLGYINNFNKILEETFYFIHAVQFSNKDFRVLFNSFQIKEPDKTFIYSDPPYIGTTDNYSSSFTEEDFKDLVKALKATECKFAISEFYSPYLEDKAKEEGLNLHLIKERKSLKNRNTEILLTNYNLANTLF